MVKGAWVTLATNDSYSLGALVLAHSLKQVGTQQELAILVTPGVTNSMRARLSDVFSIVREVNILDSRDKANLRLLQRPELGITFTKLHCWQLTEYDKCVFLDADTLVLQNCDELFEREELSAAPDVGWPDCFNSGVFVYKPSEETYNNLIQFALDKGSFDGGDQGLLNLYFADWARKDISKHLPFIYNVCSTAFYSYLPAFKQFGKDVKIIHFIGNAKPWLQYFDTESKKVRPSRDLGHLEPILQRWWNIFCSLIHPSLSPDMITSYPSDHVSARSPDQSPQQPFIAPPIPIESTNDFRPNVWDPWEDYDISQRGTTLHSPEHLESHNTTALSYVPTNDHSCIDQSSPFLDVPPADLHDHHDSDNSTHVEHSHDYQSGIETLSESNLKGDIFVENSFSASNETYTDIIPHVDCRIVQNPPTNSPVDIQNQKNCGVSISDQDLSHLTSCLPEERISQIEEVIPDEKHAPISLIPEEIPIPIYPSKYETEEDSNNVPCEVENHINDSGLAGAFAKLTLGQQRTPEQEALEDSLRRQNWEQGNIDYLGKDSFDNIWGKICETLARGPQENEGGNSAQIRNDDSVVSTQQKASAPTKEDVLPASQETPITSDSCSLPIVQEKSTTDPISSSPVVDVSSENTPSEVSVAETAPPKGEPSPVDNATITPENISASKTEETPESKNISTPTEQTQSDIVPTAKDASISAVSSEILPEKLPVGGEIPKSGSVPIEKELSDTPTPETVLVPTPILQSVSVGVEQTSQENIPSSPVAIVPSPEVSKQDLPIEKPADQLVSSTQQAPTTEQLVSPPLPVCPLKDAPPVESTTLEAIPAALTEQVVKQERDESPKTDSAGQSNISEQSSCELAKTATPTNIPQQEKVPSEEISQPIPQPEKKTTPPPTESTPVKEEPSKPEQISAEKISQPLPPTEEKITTSPSSIAPTKEAISKPTQTSPEKIPQPSSPLQETIPLSPTQVAPSKPEGTSTPVTTLQQVSAPATTSLPSTVAATPVVSSDIQPPVTAPPRKGGANKKQNKSKK